MTERPITRAESNEIVASFFEALLDELYGSERLNGTEDEAEAYLKAVIESTVDFTVTKEFLMGTNWTMNVIFDLLNFFHKQDLDSAQADTSDLDIPEDRPTLNLLS